MWAQVDLPGDPLNGARVALLRMAREPGFVIVGGSMVDDEETKLPVRAFTTTATGRRRLEQLAENVED